MKKIREKIKEEYDKFDTVQELIFTTYNFEALFFERYIVTALMNIEEINTIGALNKANEWLQEHNVSIFYDKGAISDMATHLTIDTYPIFIPNGVFHPKIILIVGNKRGKLSAHLFVSSANLTCSGYGKNIEGVADIDITSKSVVRELKSFLTQLVEKAGMTLEDKYPVTSRFLRQRRFKDDESVRFFYNFGEQKNKLYNVLTEYTGDMSIYSPYFCKEFEELIHGLKYKNLSIVPAKDGEQYNIEKSVYERCIKEQIVFKQINNERFAHVKMMGIGDSFVIGSHNFTKSALYDLNAEASLIFKLPEDKRPQTSLVEVNKNLFIKDEGERNNLDEIQSKHYIEEVTVTLDWAKQVVIINFKNITERCLIRVGKLEIYELKKGQNSPKEISFSRIDNSDKKFEEEVLTNKVFKVFKNDTVIITGLINEINWRECRPELKCSTLDEALQEWLDIANPEELERRKQETPLPPIGDDDNEEKEYNERISNNDGQKDIFDNYFSLFKVMFNLKQSIEKSEGEEQLYNTFKKSSSSICRLLELIEQDERDIIRKWIIVNELVVAVTLIKKAYRQIKKQERKIDTFSKKIKTVSGQLEAIQKEVEMYMKKSDTAWNEQYFKWIKKELEYEEG